MSSRIATPDKLREIAHDVIRYVDTHESEPYSTQSAGFLVCYAKLEIPRVIGDRTANFLRLFKGLSGDTLAGAIYNEFGFKVEGEFLPEIPVRSLNIKRDLPVSTHVFNGTWDAHDYPITSTVANELTIDVAAAAPYEPRPRPRYTE